MLGRECYKNCIKISYYLLYVSQRKISKMQLQKYDHGT